jgi:hypothetical protein
LARRSYRQHPRRHQATVVAGHGSPPARLFLRHASPPETDRGGATGRGQTALEVAEGLETRKGQETAALL